MNEKKKERKSNIELLRIVLMFIIIGHHLFIHGLINEWNQEVCLSWLTGEKYNKIISLLFFPGGGGWSSCIFYYNGIF